MSVAVALSEKKHHTSRGQWKDRAGEEARAVLHGHVPDAPPLPPSPPQGSRPPCLGEPRGPQERTQQRTTEQLADVVPMVQVLDIPVPQMVEQLPNLTQFFRALSPVPEQVIEVPKILPDDVPMRTAVRDAQLAEQLVEVPTIVSYSWLQRNMEQKGARYFAMDVGEDVCEAPASGRPAPLLEVLPQERVQRRTVEQIVDPLPVVPMLFMVEPQMVEQLVDMLSPLDFRVAEQVVDVPKIVCPPRAARTVLRAPQLAEQLVEVPTPVSYSSSLQRNVEQHVDIPVPRLGGRIAGLEGFLP